MSNKHYHNDYKKIIGFDQNRTASQKLLDRAIGKRQSTLTAVKVQSQQPKKKIKRQTDQQQQINPQSAITKILKILSLRTNTLKTQKTLQLLKKCLHEQQFINNLQIQKITQIINLLANNKQFMFGSLGQLIKICQIQRQVLECVQKIISNKFKQQLKSQLGKIKLVVEMLRLVTDDSFNFSKDVAKFKDSIFTIYQAEKNAEKPGEGDEQKINEKQVNFIEQYILYKLITLPNLHFEWARTGITCLLKQFIIPYKECLKKQKQFLVQYNKFLQGKKNTTQIGSYDILGTKRAPTGGSYTVLEKSDSTNTWVNRQ